MLKPHYHWLVADWLGLMGSKSSPQANVKVPQHPGRMRSHPRTRNRFAYLQLQQHRNENADVRVDTVPHCVEIPTPSAHRSPLNGWGSWIQRAARVATRADVEVTPHPRRKRSRTRIINIFISIYDSNNPGKNTVIRGDTAPHGVDYYY